MLTIIKQKILVQKYSNTKHEGSYNGLVGLAAKERITYNEWQTEEKYESTWDSFLELVN